MNSRGGPARGGPLHSLPERAFDRVAEPGSPGQAAARLRLSPAREPAGGGQEIEFLELDGVPVDGSGSGGVKSDSLPEHIPGAGLKLNAAYLAEAKGDAQEQQRNRPATVSPKRGRKFFAGGWRNLLRRKSSNRVVVISSAGTGDTTAGAGHDGLPRPGVHAPAAQAPSVSPPGLRPQVRRYTPAERLRASIVLQCAIRSLQSRRRLHRRRVAATNRAGRMYPLCGTKMDQTGWYQMQHQVFYVRNGAPDGWVVLAGPLNEVLHRQLMFKASRLKRGDPMLPCPSSRCGKGTFIGPDLRLRRYVVNRDGQWKEFPLNPVKVSAALAVRRRASRSGSAGSSGSSGSSGGGTPRRSPRGSPRSPRSGRSRSGSGSRAGSAGSAGSRGRSRSRTGSDAV